MGKPNLKNMLLAIIGLMASVIFITKAIVPWMVNPVKEWERKATDRKNKINSLQKTQKTADLYRKRLAKLNTQGFASSQAEASASMGEHITGLIRQSGLSETAFSRRPFEPRAIVKNGPKPVGYTVNGQGSLKKVTDLIYLLQNDPHIHRVENISLSPVSGSTDVRVNFQFLSLVIGTQYGKFTGTNAPRFSRRSTARIEVFTLGSPNAPCFCRIKNSPRLLRHLRRNRNQNRLPLRPRPALRPTRLSPSPNGRENRRSWFSTRTKIKPRATNWATTLRVEQS